MKLFIDSADVSAIKRINKILAIDGVTTNPQIIAKTKKDVKLVINEIIDILDDEQLLFIQVVSSDVEGMINEAKYINALRKNTYAKIPVTTNGLIAIKECHKLGLKVLATAIYSAEQAFLAAKNGADCLAPYVNRMCNYTDGVEVVKDIQQIIDNYHFDTYILAASFKNVNQVHELLKAGIESLTLPVDVLENMYSSLMVDKAVEDFNNIWADTYHRNHLI